MSLEKLRPYLIVVVLGLGLYVSLSPGLVFAPAPRIVLFFILAVIPALLFGNEVQSRFQIELPGFIFSVIGAGAIFFGALFLLEHLSKPEQQIAVFHFYDESGNKLMLDRTDAIDIPETSTGLTVTRFVKANTVVLIFPEQVAEIPVTIKKYSQDKGYTGTLTYAGSREARIDLGKQFKQQ